MQWEMRLCTAPQYTKISHRQHHQPLREQGLQAAWPQDVPDAQGFGGGALQGPEGEALLPLACAVHSVRACGVHGGWADGVEMGNKNEEWEWFSVRVVLSLVVPTCSRCGSVIFVIDFCEPSLPGCVDAVHQHAWS